MTGKMAGRTRKRSRISFSPFTGCPCCAGPVAYGRTAERRLWRAEYADDMTTKDLSIARGRVLARGFEPPLSRI